MRRRDFISNTAALGIIAAVTVTGQNARPSTNQTGNSTSSKISQLIPPPTGKIPVAFAISDLVTIIDFCGPWEVFQDVYLPTRGQSDDERAPFELFTVSAKTLPIRGSAGLQLVPDYTFETAPQPKIVVVPAQKGSDALHAWLRKVTPSNDLTMSVCTGAFHLAQAGLLSGKSATTHHDSIDYLAKKFPDIDVKRGLRFVDSSNKISTAGGLTSGIDLALHVVERYFGRDVAQHTAVYMEYQSTSWMV